MRPGLRRTLEGYGAVIKRVLQKEEEHQHAQQKEDPELTKLAHAAEFLTEERARAVKGDLESQRNIYAFQEQKQDIMRELKRKFRAIEQGEAVESQEENKRLVYYVAKTDTYFVVDQEGNEFATTAGALLTDVEWGLSYHLDQKSIPAHLQKKFYTEEAKKEIMDLLDKQIVHDELSRTVERHRGISGLPPLFERNLEDELTASGWLAEVMVHNFLKRLEIDFNLPIRVTKADCYDDTANKIDFYIRRTDYRRAAQIEADESEVGKQVGIQFTLTHAVAKKRKQLKKVKERVIADEIADDLLLVKVPVSTHITAAMRLWEERGKPPGGPEQFWPLETKKRCFRKTLDGIFSQEQVETFWQHVVASLNEQTTEKDLADFNRHLAAVESDHNKRLGRSAENANSYSVPRGRISKPEIRKLRKHFTQEWLPEFKTLFPEQEGLETFILTIFTHMINDPNYRKLEEASRLACIKGVILRRLEHLENDRIYNQQKAT